MGDNSPRQDGHERPRARLIKENVEVEVGLVCGLKMDEGGMETGWGYH